MTVRDAPGTVGQPGNRARPSAADRQDNLRRRGVDLADKFFDRRTTWARARGRSVTAGGERDSPNGVVYRAKSPRPRWSLRTVGALRPIEPSSHDNVTAAQGVLMRRSSKSPENRSRYLASPANYPRGATPRAGPGAARLLSSGFRAIPFGVRPGTRMRSSSHG